MASLCGRARQALQCSTTRNAVSKLCNIKSTSFSGSSSSKLPGFASSSSNPRFSLPKLFTSSRIPVELGCVDSLMPLHSATASALLTSMLSLHSQSWGCLSEGFATPL